MSQMQVTDDPAVRLGLAKDVKYHAYEAMQAYPGWQSWQNLYGQIMYGRGARIGRS